MTAKVEVPRLNRNATTTPESVSELMKLSLAPVEIADRLGLATVTVRSTIRKLDPSYAGREKPGLSDKEHRGETRDVATGLGIRLYDFEESSGLSKTQISSVIGINRRERLLARSIPFSHNWTLGQIARLARAINMSVNDLLFECIYRPLPNENYFIDLANRPLSPSQWRFARDMK